MRAGASVALLVLTLGLSACGSGHVSARAPRATSEEGSGPVAGVSPADSVAYYQLATASGFLRASAAAARARPQLPEPDPGNALHFRPLRLDRSPLSDRTLHLQGR